MKELQAAVLDIIRKHQIDRACDANDLSTDVVCEILIDAALKSGDIDFKKEMILARDEGIEIAASYCDEDLSTFEPVSKIHIDGK